MSNICTGPDSSSQAVPDSEVRTVPRDKVQAARFSPQEWKEVEAAARREGRSPSTWLRDVALQAARPAPDTTELVLAEVAATRYMLLNLFHASATAMQQKSILTPEAVLKIRETADSRKHQTAKKFASGICRNRGQDGRRSMREPLLIAGIVLSVVLLNVLNLTPSESASVHDDAAPAVLRGRLPGEFLAPERPGSDDRDADDLEGQAGQNREGQDWQEQGWQRQN